jgi:hypothetical protein
MPIFVGGGGVVTSATIVDGEILNADISPSAAIDPAKIASLGYIVLADVTLAIAGTAFASGTFAAKSVLKILVYATSVGNTDVVRGVFNADTGANYTQGYGANQAGLTVEGGQNSFKLEATENQGAKLWVLDIINIATLAKHGVYTRSGTAQIENGMFIWGNTTDPITAFSVTHNANFGAGSRMIVLGL